MGEATSLVAAATAAAQTAPPLLLAHNIAQTFADGAHTVQALADVDLQLRHGEFACLIGPSGSGKSTLLNILAGLDPPTAGEVWLEGKVTTARERLGRVGLMPQRDLLLPWRTALDNAIVGLQVRGVSRRDASAQARDLFARFDLTNFANSYPFTLSGGMRQRVALVRSALAAGTVLLLDEPFGALDALTRSDLHRWLLQVWRTLDKTLLLVTHDVDEALILADRVYVLTPRPGRVRATLTIDLPRPRDDAVRASAAFSDLRRHLLDQLGEHA